MPGRKKLDAGPEKLDAEPQFLQREKLQVTSVIPGV